MSTTDGARSGGDPVLEGALTEMASEGTFDATATFADPAPDAASQASDTASAAPKADAPAPTGDAGSIKPDSSTAPSVAAPSAAPAAADPLDGTSPFTYGEGKSLPWAHRVPGEGLLLTEAEVPQFQRLVEERDVLDRVNRESQSTIETFERLSTWTRPGVDGKEETLTGQKGLEAIHTDFAQLAAEASVYRDLLNDPAKLLGLMAKNERGEIVLDPASVKNWNTEIKLAQIEAAQSIQTQIGSILTPPAPSPGSTPINYEAAAPGVIKAAAGQDFGLLTAEDRSLLAGQLPRYVRPLTKEELPWNPGKKVGDSVVDPSFQKVVSHLAAQRKTSADAAKAAEKAGAHNAGMEKGRQPAKAAPKTPPAPTGKPAEPARKKADWDSPFTDAMAELGVPIR